MILLTLRYTFAQKNPRTWLFLNYSVTIISSVPWDRERVLRSYTQWGNSFSSIYWSFYLKRICSCTASTLSVWLAHRLCCSNCTNQWRGRLWPVTNEHHYTSELPKGAWPKPISEPRKRHYSRFHDWSDNSPGYYRAAGYAILVPYLRELRLR